MSKIKLFSIFLLTILFIFLVIYINSLSFKLKNFLKTQDAEIELAVIKENKIWVFGDKKQPLLSVFKYCVALKVLNKLEKEDISLDATITVKENMIDKDLYSPMLKKYTYYPFKISIRELLEYMISESDNNACDILINYIGGIDNLNNFLQDIGFRDIEILSNEKEMNSDISKQYLNKACPKDIVNLMKSVREGEILSPESKIFLDKIMINTKTGENKLKAGLPADVIIGHKTGSSSRTSDGIKIADNDAGYIILPDGDVYYIAVMIKDSKMSDEDNAKVISEVSQIVYEYFTVLMQ